MAGKGKTQSSKMPEAGDMVEFPRKPGYSHYGIADGKGNVIHATSGETRIWLTHSWNYTLSNAAPFN